MIHADFICYNKILIYLNNPDNPRSDSKQYFRRMRGLVIKSTGSRYNVRMDDGKVIPCSIRGILRLKGFEATSPITVGDHVEVDFIPGDETGQITKLIDRKNYIIRKSVKLSKQVQILAANIDRAWVVATPVLPKTSLGFIDRFLATAEAYRIPGGIIFNKADIYDEGVWEFVNELKSLYENINYKVCCVSALNGIGMDELRKNLSGQVNLFSGHSGVGKSSLVNRLLPALKLKTSGLSSQHFKGTHTTTFA